MVISKFTKLRNKLLNKVNNWKNKDRKELKRSGCRIKLFRMLKEST